MLSAHAGDALSSVQCEFRAWTHIPTERTPRDFEGVHNRRDDSQSHLSVDACVGQSKKRTFAKERVLSLVTTAA